jgi:hypothetical protein
LTGIQPVVYYLVGFLVLANLGTIGSLMMVGFRVVWFISKLEEKINEAKDCAVRSHKRIDEMENEKQRGIK